MLMCVISESEFRLGFKLCFISKFYSRYIVSYLKIIVICCTYWGTHVYHSQRMKVKGQLGESFFMYYMLGSQDQTQIIRIDDGKYL